MDWNWFFAAYAQCAAALIAIIGAFTISKLLGENEKVEELSQSLDSLSILHSEIIKRIGARYFDWCDRITISNSDEINSFIKNEEFIGKTDEELSEKLFLMLPKLYGTSKCLENFKKRIQEDKPKYHKIGENASVSMANFSLPKITDFKLMEDLIEEKAMISSLKIESETLIEKFKLLKKSAVSLRSNLVPINVTIWILIIGVVATVIYPLHLMPIRNGAMPNIVFSLGTFIGELCTLKGVLLLLLGVVINGIFMYFYLISKRIYSKYQHIDREISDKYTELNSYSKYFVRPNIPANKR